MSQVACTISTRQGTHACVLDISTYVRHAWYKVLLMIWRTNTDACS